MKNLLTKLFFITLVLSAQNLFATGGVWGGDGSSGNPWKIADATDLGLLATNVNAGTDYSGIFFQQTADFACPSWTPIGIDVVGSRFSGTYDGNNHKITSLTISSSANDLQALFGFVVGATITNLGVEGVSITTTGLYVGGLIGEASTNCVITNCYSTGTVSGLAIVGGLIGISADNTEITNCYSTVAVTATSGTNAGGLIGICNRASAATAVTNCYSAGVVNGSAATIGGLVGANIAGVITYNDCFWDTETSGQSSSIGGTGKTTAQMKTKSTYTNWDNTGTIWKIDLTAAINGGYPFLAWQNAGGTTLPVELTSFTSAVNKSGVTLRWSTATEVNNYGFNVERRSVTSAGSWVKIGFIAGHGTSNSTISYSYADAGLASGRYAYRLKQIDNGGAFKYSQSIELEVVSLAPAVIGLSQNYPNPFNPSTQISFSVSNTEQAKLVVYNVLGQPVTTLFEGMAIGQQSYKLSFDASKLTSGVYFYKLETPSRTEVRRMQLLK